ncbi:MAG: copper amine oxidase [Ruminococcaceae bacterium]|nr:copper amine oxidase [Oscillospiraceae bacterium]
MRKIKRTALFITCVALICAMLTPMISAAAPGFPSGTTPIAVKLDGQAVMEGESVLINSVTYVPVRRFSELMGADSISWNQKTSTATVKKGIVTMYFTSGALYVEANGRYFFTVQKILNVGGRLYVPIRAIAEAFSVDVAWDASTRTVLLSSTGKTLVSGSSYYDANDVYWLSRIINAEAGGESLIGMIAVGNVVLNRKESKMYPNTVYGVIFDRVGGTQFSPVSMGTIYRTPSKTSIIAAKICLDGYSVDDKILFFMNPSISTSNWISKNRPFAFVLGRHYFYY